MANRKNLIHEKLKKVKPNDIVKVRCTVPAYLLEDVKTYGDTAKVIMRALEMSIRGKFIAELKANILSVQQSMEKLSL